MHVPAHAPASHEPAPHEMHAIAPVPHASFRSPVRHSEPAQQPLQLVELHAAVAHVPFVHAVPRQSRQALPPLPQYIEVLSSTQRPPMQQPEGHEAAVH